MGVCKEDEFLEGVFESKRALEGENGWWWKVNGGCGRLSVEDFGRLAG